MHVYDYYMSMNKDVLGNYDNASILETREVYYGMNVELDEIIGSTIDTAFSLGYNESNTVFLFTSDHGEMNMEHRQIWKNSLYEGSSRIPLFFAGPNIRKGILYQNATQIIDIMPTLIDLGGGDIPEYLSGYSLKPWLEGDENKNKHPDYIIASYFSTSGNTGSFMVRKDNYKYIQFGHYLTTVNKTLYRPQLFDLDADPNEVDDISGDSTNENLLQEMEQILTDNIDYEYIDCVAKQNDFMMFDRFYWNVYNQSYLWQLFSNNYIGFNETDWETVVSWRNTFLNQPSCKAIYLFD